MKSRLIAIQLDISLLIFVYLYRENCSTTKIGNFNVWGRTVRFLRNSSISEIDAPVSSTWKTRFSHLKKFPIVHKTWQDYKKKKKKKKIVFPFSISNFPWKTSISATKIRISFFLSNPRMKTIGIRKGEKHGKEEYKLCPSKNTVVALAHVAPLGRVVNSIGSV